MNNKENQHTPPYCLGGSPLHQQDQAMREPPRPEGNSTPKGVSGGAHHNLSPIKLGHMLILKGVEENINEVDISALS